MEQNSSEEEIKDKQIDINSIYSYNDALTLTGMGKFHFFLLITCGLCLMSVIVETLNIGFILPLIDYECELKLSLSEKGILSSSAFAGLVTSSYILGFLADIFGRKKIMIICSTWSFAFSFLSSFSTHTWMLIITRFLVGFFISGLAANTYAYLGEFHCDKNRARHLNFCGVFMALALTFCPGLGWIILKLQEANSISFYISIINVNYSMWRIYILLCSLISLIITISLSFLPESPKFLLIQDKHDEALKILKKIHKINDNSSFYPVPKINFNEQLMYTFQSSKPNYFYLKLLWTQTTPLFKSPLFNSTWKLSFIMFSLFASSSGFYLWTPEVLNQMLKYPSMSVCDVIDKVTIKKNSTIASSCSVSINVDDRIYVITFFMGVFFSIVYFLNGLIINKFGKRNLLGLWFFICGLSSILIPFNNNFYVILLLLLLFLTSGCNGSIASAICVDVFPTNIRAISLCIILTIGRLGAIAGSLFVSYMIVTSCELMFIIFGLILVFSVLVSCTIAVD